jgi:hypothetical protein
MAEILSTEAANRVAVPEATPQIQAPDDYQRINANPAQFGGLVVEGEEKLGQGIGVAGKFFSQVAADDATNQYMEGTHKILYGTGQKDPVTGEVDTGYYGKKGRAALDARPQVEAQLAALQKNIRGGLQTPEQELQFDGNTRRIQYYVGSEMGRFADQQTDAYAADVNKTGYTNEIQAVASRPEDDVFAAAAAQRALSYRTKLAQISGEANDPEKLAQIRMQTAQDITEARIKALVPTNAPAAMDLLNRNKSFLQGSQNYDALYSTVHGKLIDQQGVAIGQKAINDAGVAFTQPGTAPTVNQAILGQEGNKDNEATSVNGAVGPAQVIPSTFSQYAQPGERIDNPTDNRNVANRIINDYSQRYPGDPARVAVAYFSGPGNVAPAGSATPWINNAKDGTGKTTSSYVSDVLGRLQGANPHIALKASAYDQVMQATDDPQVQQKALSYVRQQYDAAQVASLSDQKARKDASDQASSGYVTQMMKGQVTPDLIGKIADDPRLADEPEVKTRLWELALTHSGSDVDKASNAYGPGFWGIYKSIVDPGQATGTISDPRELLKRAGPGGDLTLAGVDRLMGVLQGKKTPEGAAEQKMQSGAFDVIKRELSGQDSLPGLKDPQGEKIFQHAMPLLYQAIEQGKAKGIPPSQLYDPESKDWIGNTVAGLKRQPAQYYADLESANGSSQTEQAPTDITKMNPQQLADGFFAAKTDEEKQKFRDEAVKRGLAAAPVPSNTGPQVPIAQ